MKIRATCPNGHAIAVETKFAGKLIRCPRCQTPYVVEEPVPAKEELLRTAKPEHVTPPAAKPARDAAPTLSPRRRAVLAIAGAAAGAALAGPILWAVLPTPAPESTGGQLPVAVAPPDEPAPHPAAEPVESPPQPAEPAVPSPERSIRVKTVGKSIELIALNQRAGELAVIDDQTLKVFGLDPSQNLPPRSVTVSGERKPKALLWKAIGERSFYLVGFGYSPHITILDADSLAIVSRVTTPGQAVHNLEAPASPLVPTVWYADVPRASFRSREFIPHSETADPQSGLVFVPAVIAGLPSARGSFVLTDEFGRLVVSCQPSLHLRLLTLSRPNVSHDWIYPDDFEAVAGHGRKLMSADLTREITQFDFRVRAFFPDRPWVVGVNEAELCAASLNSFDTVGRIQMPSQVLLPGTAFTEHRPWSDESVPRVFCDPRHDAIALAGSGSVAVIPLEKLSLPAEGLLRVSVDCPPTWEVNQPLAARLTKTNPELDVKLVEAPEGLTLDGDTLRWTPKAEQVGLQQATLQLALGEHRVEQSVYWDVCQPHIALPEQIVGVAGTEDGRRALVLYGAPRFVADTRRSDDFATASLQSAVFTNSDESQRHIALVDVEAMQVLVKAPLERGMHVNIGLDAHYAYTAIAPSSEPKASRQWRLQARSLNELNVIKEVVVQDASQLRTIADQILETNSARFAVPSLEPLPMDGPPFQQKLKLLERPAPWVDSQGAVRVGARGERLFLWSVVTPEGWRSLPEAQFPLLYPRRPPGLDRKQEHDFIGAVPHLAIGVWRPSDPYPKKPRPMAELELRELMTGRVLNKLSVAHQFETRQRDSVQEVVAGSTLLLVVRGLLFPIDLKNHLPQTAPEDLHFARHAQRMIAPTDRRFRLKYELVGGEAPFEVRSRIYPSLQSEQNATDWPMLEGDDGDRIVELEHERETVLDAARRNLTAWLRSALRQRRIDLEADGQQIPPDRMLLNELIDAYTARVEPVFVELAGRNPRGLPVGVAFELDVTDRLQGRCAMSHWLYVELSDGEVTGLVRDLFGQ